MKVIVKIGPYEHDLDEVDKHQLIKEIVGLRKEGPVCVRATIRDDDVNVLLSTGACSRAGGGRPANRKERRIIELWDKRGLNDHEIAPGQLNAFLSEILR